MVERILYSILVALLASITVMLVGVILGGFGLASVGDLLVKLAPVVGILVGILHFFKGERTKVL